MRVVVLSALLTALPVAARGELRFSLGGEFLFGDVDGYVQTPSGGQPGTTSARRPTLDEIGINSTAVYDAQITASTGENELYAGAQWIHMSGSATLDQTLISQGRTFAAGTHVSSEVDLDWYRFGYRRRLRFGHGDWTMWPSAGVAVLDFHYRLSGADVVADRSYSKGNVQFGLETQWRPNQGRFSLNLILLACPPISPPLPQMQVEELLVEYHLLEDADNDLDLTAGAAMEQIYFEDDQGTPNRINADLGPMFVVGFHWSF